MSLKKGLKDATALYTSNLAAKRDFVSFKAEFDNLGMNKLVNIPTSFDDFLKNVDVLDVGKLKTVLADLRKLSDVVSKEVVKNPKFKK